MRSPTRQSRKVVDAIANTPTGPSDRPLQDVVIERVEIERRLD